jgi:hemerythrin superfamily protein
MKVSSMAKSEKEANPLGKDAQFDAGKETDAMVPNDEITQVLHRDHMKVDNLFFQFKQAEDDKRKEEIVAAIAFELGIHAKAEEEIVYPVVRDGKEEVEDLMDEADTEHHVVKFLIAELQGMKASDSHYDSKVTVLCELVKHHVEEEEKEIFEKLKSSDENLEELGQKFTERKLQLAEKPLPQEIFPVAGSEPKQRKLA